MTGSVDPRPRHSSQTWAEVERLFRATLEMGPEERNSWLSEECPDPFLRSEAERLLRAHDVAGDFLDALDTENVARLVGAVSLAEPDREATGPYRIVRRLARGGTGVVYLARDERLGRSVALKCLSPPLEAYPDVRQRFLGEARAASRLDHPNIATVHDVGETSDGGLYIAMSYYEGETLAQRIAGGPLEVDEALELAAQIAGALGAAHAADIVHRDVKPANVIVTPNGEAKVLDFGIAKTDDGQPTRSGLRLGTVAYMSPEQTRGDPVGPSTDVWSFGALLYEVLGGRRPFAGPSDAVIIHAIRHDDPLPLVRLRPEVPLAIIEIVERCLKRDPAQRYESGAELEKTLRAVRRIGTIHRRPAGRVRQSTRAVAIRGISGLIALLVVGLLVARGDTLELANEPTRSANGATMPIGTARAWDIERYRLAVLPLTSLGGPGTADYLADGLTEELMSRLATVDRLRVIGRTSSMAYRDTDVPIAEISRELEANVLLAGSVRQVGDRVRIDVQLVDGRTEELLWSDDFEAGLGDLLPVQTSIVQRIARTLDLGLPGDELAVVRDQRPAVQESYLSYLRGRYYWAKRTPDDLERARSEFQHALDLDPAYSEAWAGLSDTFWLLATVGTLSPDESARMSRAAAERALAIDGNLAEAHSALATVLMSYHWDWEGAARHFQLALANNPSYWIARFRYANLLAVRGRFEEAIGQARLAADLDPLSSYARAGLGFVMYLAGHNDEAISHLEGAARTDPDFFLTHLDLALAYLEKGMPDRAVEAATRASQLSGRFQAAVGLLGHAYAVAGRTENARAVLEELTDQPAGRHVNPFNLGMVYLGLREHERAIDHFVAAASERAPLAEFLGVDPVFDALLPYPRFQSLLRQHDLDASARG